MEFLKKNWVRLIMALVLLAGFVVALIGLFKVFGVTGHKDWKAGLELIKDDADALKEAKAGPNALIFKYLAMAIAFLGFTAILVMKMLGLAKGIVPFVAIGTGVVALIFLIIAVMNGVKSEEFVQAKDALKILKELEMTDELAYKGAAMNYYEMIAPYIINIFVFGCLPILYGIKKMFCKCCCKSTTQE